jgi:hypothetical protein
MKYNMANKIINKVDSFEIYHITKYLIKKSVHRNRNKSFQTLSSAVPEDLAVLGAAGVTYIHTVHSRPSIVRFVCEVFCSKIKTLTCS